MDVMMPQIQTPRDCSRRRRISIQSKIHIAKNFSKDSFMDKRAGRNSVSSKKDIGNVRVHREVTTSTLPLECSDLQWERTFMLQSIREGCVSDIASDKWAVIQKRILEYPDVLQPVKIGNDCYEQTILGALCSTNMNCDNDVAVDPWIIGSDRRCTPVDVIRTVLTLRPDLVLCHQRRVGHTPLRDAVRNVTVSPLVLEWLVQADPGSVHEPDRYGCTPLDHLIHDIPNEDCHSRNVDRRLQSLLRHASPLGDYKSPLLTLLSAGCSCTGPACGGSLEWSGMPSHREGVVLECVRLLLQWNPNLIASNSKVTGCTPLHMALRNYGNSVPLLRELLERDTDGAALCHRNRFGDLALHVACSSGVSMDVLQLILSATLAVNSGDLGSNVINSSRALSLKPHSLVWSSNCAGHTPIDLEWIRYVDAGRRIQGSCRKDTARRAKAVYESLLQQSVDQALNLPVPSLCSLDGTGRLLRRVLLLIRATTRHDITPTILGDDNVLHQVAALSGPHGPVLAGPWLDFFSEIFAEQISRLDHMGRLPLHYAVQLRNTTEESSKKSMQEWQRWVDKLLHIHPAACRSRDQCGRLPLHYALSFDSLNTTTKPTAQEARNVVVQTIVDAYPLAVELRDTVTGLSPFQLAATNPLISIETLYRLLRMSPNAIVQ